MSQHPYKDDFVAALLTDGPKHPSRMRRFGQLVGTWHVSGSRLDDSTGEWADRDFTWVVAWVLDGSGIQDLEVITLADGSTQTIATALRVYDHVAGLTRVTYLSPAANQYCQLVANGWRDGIRQDGTQNDERPIRWNFSDITDDSYSWDGWVSDDDGANWRLVEHLEGTRIS